jgi:hypothetical protein
MYLKRYHDLTISPSGVWRILNDLGLSRLPASQRYKRKDTNWKPHEKQRPGHALQVDGKFIEPLWQTGKKKRYLPLHRHRRRHPPARAAGLPNPRPKDRELIHRPRPV